MIPERIQRQIERIADTADLSNEIDRMFDKMPYTFDDESREKIREIGTLISGILQTKF